VGDAFLILAELKIAKAVVYPSKRYKYSALKSDTLVHLSRLAGSYTRKRRMEGAAKVFQSWPPAQAHLIAHSLCGDKDPDVHQ